MSQKTTLLQKRYKTIEVTTDEGASIVKPGELIDIVEMTPLDLVSFAGRERSCRSEPSYAVAGWRIMSGNQGTGSASGIFSRAPRSSQNETASLEQVFSRLDIRASRHPRSAVCGSARASAGALYSG
jgi:hypothetical protein